MTPCRFRRTGVRLEVAQRLRLDIALELGAVAEVVEVTAEVPRVQTEDSSLGTVVENKRIAELPLNGRHVFNLVKVVAGVQPRSSSVRTASATEGCSICDVTMWERSD